MIPYGLFSQIFLIIVSITIVITFIKPTFAEITETLDETEIYQEEIDKVSAVNQKLENLVTSYGNVSQSDRLKLLTYMPDEADTIAIPRDLYAIALEAGLLVKQIAYDGPLAPPAPTMIQTETGEIFYTQDDSPRKHLFQLSLEGSYAQIKDMMELMEQNVYPLEVQTMTITGNEGGFLMVDMNVATYEQAVPADAEPALQ